MCLLFPILKWILYSHRNASSFVLTADKSCAGFKCNSGECIALSKLCDNIGDCLDKSDENKKCCEVYFSSNGIIDLLVLIEFVFLQI